MIEQVVRLPPSLRVVVSIFAAQRNTCQRQHTGRTHQPDRPRSPTEAYYHRGTDGITVNLWPLPGDGGPYTLLLHCLRRIQDAGAFTNTGDFPFRFLPVFVAGLAYYIAQKKRRDDPNLVQTLKAEYAEAWQAASEGTAIKSTLQIIPRGSTYRTYN